MGGYDALAEDYSVEDTKFFFKRNQSWESSFWGGRMSTWEISL